ncbi:MAG: hypothetical protein AABM41_01160 [Chloroflexota bacterium]
MHHGDLAPTMARSGRANGPENAAFNRWFRYPAGFSPEALSATLQAIGNTAGLAVDPFAGVATSAIPLARAGWRFRGIEVHPAIAEIASLKLSRPGDPNELADVARAIAQDAPDGEWSAEHAMIQKSFAPEVLASLVGLRSSIEKGSRKWQLHLKWALLATLRDVAAVKVGWPYQRPDVERQAPHKSPRSRFVERAEQMAHDLALSPEPPDALVSCGDSRDEAVWQRLLGSTLAQACVSSPPYLNNYDYADATRLELYFWKTVGSWAELTTVVRANMVTASTQQTSIAKARDAGNAVAGWGNLGREILLVRDRVSRERRRRARGKEYDSLIPMYFLDLMNVLKNVRAHLEKDGVLAWVVGDSAPYGVLVDTPAFVSRMAEMVGLHAVQDRRLRSRGERWVSNGSRHHRALSERLIVLRG